jgi:hypothetical protein
VAQGQTRIAGQAQTCLFVAADDHALRFAERGVQAHGRDLVAAHVGERGDDLARLALLELLQQRASGELEGQRTGVLIRRRKISVPCLTRPKCQWFERKNAKSVHSQHGMKGVAIW